MASWSLSRWRLLVAFVLWMFPAAVFADTVTLAWDPSDGATGYTVRWGTAEGSYPNVADAGSATTFNITGLTAGGTYWTVVQAYNSSGVSPYSTALQFTVPGTVVTCTASISPGSVSAASSGSSGSVTVTTSAGCSWTAASGSSGLTFQSSGGSGPGSVMFSVAANTATSPRTLTGTVAGQSFIVSQLGQTCTYAISPATASAPSAGSTGSISVTTQTGCAWSATSSDAGLTFTNGTGRTGSGSVTFTAAANTAVSSRTLTATVASQAFSVTQAGASCTYAISPATANAASSGSTGTVTVTTQAGCAWDATTTDTGLTFTNGTGRTGSGSVTYTVAANPNGSSRTLAASVAGKAFTATQAAAPCTFTISPTTLSAPYGGTSGSITVTTPAGCAWTATSATGVVAFQNGTGRTGPGTVNYTVAANPGTISRTATAAVAGQVFTVSQAAAPQACTYAISPASTSAPTAGASGAINVTTQPGCTWNATSFQTFLTFPDGASRTGSGTVTYVVAANTAAARTATATIAGKTFSVSQTGNSCTYSISPMNITRTPAAYTGTVSVATQPGCAWTATTQAEFLAFADGTGRTGSGTVTFSLTQNTDAATRNAAALIAGSTFTVAQSGTSSQAPAPLRWSSDFDGDGKNDILVQDSVTGTIEAWFLDNATVKGTQALGDVPDTDWMLVGRGDFNADGKPDLVWQHKTQGTVSIRYMDGTTPIGLPVTVDEIPDPQWKIVGVGDFNQDQHADLVWQHQTTGAIFAWLLNGATMFAYPGFGPDRMPDTNWKVVGVADFNGDSKPDILWRNMSTGDIGAWLMNGFNRIVYAPLSPMNVADQRWQVGAVTDANGDGKPDIVWQHTDGSIMIWHMNLTSRVSSPTLPLTLPVGWFLVGPK